MTIDGRPIARQPHDRRRRWPPLSRRFWIGGRRRRARRRDDPGHTHADIGPGLRLAVVAVVLGSALDACLTLVLLGRGASEANPVMAAALAWGEEAFLAIKLGGTALGAMVLAVHHEWALLRRVPVRWVVTVLAGVYVAVIAWEVWLLALPPLGAMPPG